jgi:hypothetical protein
MAVLSKLWIAYIHLTNSSKKDDYLKTNLKSYVSSVTLANTVPARRSWIYIPLPPDHVPPHSQLYHSDQESKTVPAESSGNEAPALTLCANLRPITRPDCPSKCRSFYHSQTPSAWKTVANVPRRKDALRSSSSKKKLHNPPCPQTKSHQYKILGHRKETMLQLQIAISPWRDHRRCNQPVLVWWSYWLRLRLWPWD